MPVLRESAIERKVVHDVYKKWGIQSVKIKAVGARGWPDRLFLIPGNPPRPLFIEFKRKGEEAEPLQKYIHKKIRAAGYTVEVIDNYEDALWVIDIERGLGANVHP